MKKITPIGLLAIGLGWILLMLILFHYATFVHPSTIVSAIALFFFLIVTPLVMKQLYKNTPSSFINLDRRKLKKLNESVRQQLLEKEQHIDATVDRGVRGLFKKK